MISELSLILFAYVMGSLTTGYYLVKWLAHKDIRQEFSGSVGASNVKRILGKKGYYLTLAGDILRGFAVMAVAKMVHATDWCQALMFLALVVGHIWPAQLGFKGGKGVTVALSGLLIWNYPLLLLLGGLILLFYLICRSVKRAAALAMLLMPLASFFLMQNAWHYLILLLVSIIILYAHRENIIAATTELT